MSFVSVMNSVAERMVILKDFIPMHRLLCPCSPPARSSGSGKRDIWRPIILLLIYGAASLFLRSLFFLCPIFFIFIIVCKFPKQRASPSVFAFGIQTDSLFSNCSISFMLFVNQTLFLLIALFLSISTTSHCHLRVLTTHCFISHR